jgi:hypothetical protein
MQKTVHIFLFLFFSILATAQNFSVSSTYTSSQGRNGEEVAPTVTLRNTGNTSIELKWEKIRNNAPQGWEIVVCDKQCYTGLVESKTFTLAPGESLNDFRVSFRPNGVDGIGNVEIKISEVRNPASSTTVVFAASAQNSGIGGNQNPSNTLNIYPNPAIDHIMIQDDGEQVKYLEVYNVVGRKIMDFSVRNDGVKYDVSSLPRGMYMVRMLDRNRNILRTQRISKYNP